MSRSYDCIAGMDRGRSASAGQRRCASRLPAAPAGPARRRRPPARRRGDAAPAGAAPTRAGERRSGRRVSRCRKGTRGRSTHRPSPASTAGSTVIEPSTATATTRIAPTASELKIALPVRNMPAIATATRAAGDDHGPPGGRRRDLHRVQGGAAAGPLLTGPPDVEERVVDADGHPDQQHHARGGVGDRQQMRGQRGESHRSRHRGEREQHRHRGGQQRAEGHDQDDQRDRQAEQLGLPEVPLVRVTAGPCRWSRRRPARPAGPGTRPGRPPSRRPAVRRGRPHHPAAPIISARTRTASPRRRVDRPGQRAHLRQRVQPAAGVGGRGGRPIPVQRAGPAGDQDVLHRRDRRSGRPRTMRSARPHSPTAASESDCERVPIAPPTATHSATKAHPGEHRPPPVLRAPPRHPDHPSGAPAVPAHHCLLPPRGDGRAQRCRAFRPEVAGVCAASTRTGGGVGPTPSRPAGGMGSVGARPYGGSRRTAVAGCSRSGPRYGPAWTEATVTAQAERADGVADPEPAGPRVGLRELVSADAWLTTTHLLLGLWVGPRGLHPHGRAAGPVDRAAAALPDRGAGARRHAVADPADGAPRAGPLPAGARRGHPRLAAAAAVRRRARPAADPDGLDRRAGGRWATCCSGCRSASVQFALTIVFWSVPIALLTLPIYNWALPNGGAALGFGITVRSWWSTTLVGVLGLVLLVLSPRLVRWLGIVDIAFARRMLGPSGRARRPGGRAGAQPGPGGRRRRAGAPPDRARPARRRAAAAGGAGDEPGPGQGAATTRTRRPPAR